MKADSFAGTLNGGMAAVRTYACRVSFQALSHFVRPWILTAAVVDHFMATCAQRNQIGILIRAPLTALLLVVNLQILPRATDLTPPVATLHHPLAKQARKLLPR